MELIRLEPYTKKLHVDPAPEVTERETKGGIFVQEHYSKRDGMKVHLRWGTLFAIGAECEHRMLKTGMRIMYNPFDASALEDGTVLIPTMVLRA